ncbi:RdgB/HAM1 family non-canonical purine NTP pyrophosphatase [Batrachochytrium salamandrivorans]|nr:RdgB/HAM1 family non-canonical purine NTP pyrophosphatase [Batrachochytrium salamandrivorans]
MKQISFVTSNDNKLAEVQRALQTRSSQPLFELTKCTVDLLEPQGDPEDVAREKCMLAAKQVSGPVMVEDTSLCFNALHGLPGVYVKWFLDKTGRQGLVNLLAAYEDKSAYAQCIFALTAGEGHPVHVFVGRTQGEIVTPRGPEQSFGWDPVFQPNDCGGKTFAEMTKDEKNAISHRGKALEKMCDFIATWDVQSPAKKQRN